MKALRRNAYLYEDEGRGLLEARSTFVYSKVYLSSEGGILRLEWSCE